jgi:hypothetical protein
MGGRHHISTNQPVCCVYPKQQQTCQECSGRSGVHASSTPLSAARRRRMSRWMSSWLSQKRQLWELSARFAGPEPPREAGAAPCADERRSQGSDLLVGPRRRRLVLPIL